MEVPLRQRGGPDRDEKGTDIPGVGVAWDNLSSQKPLMPRWAVAIRVHITGDEQILSIWRASESVI